MSTAPSHRRGPSLLAIGIGTLLAVCLFTLLVSILSRRQPPAGVTWGTATSPAPKLSAEIVDGSLSCETWTADTMQVSGRVQNAGTAPTRSIEVVVIALDGSAEVSQTRTYADDGQLDPGKITGFTGYVTTTGADPDGCRARVGEIR